MTDPMRTSAASEPAAESKGPLDPTHAPGTVPEPPFAAPAHVGEVGMFGRYRVLQKLGQGGMGAVYLGFDAALDRKVALKVMLPQYAESGAARERFLREARAAAKIKSDYVVTIFDVGEERGAPFIAMEYLLGLPLDKFLKTKGELPLDQVLRIARETALGLAAAHDLGLVHRDIKPGNVWLEAPKGRVKILDFGLARADSDEQLTGSGAVMGTPAYMSPEQGRGQKLDARSDLFSLGVMLYRLCTGKLPFTGQGAMAVLTSLAVDTPAAPRVLNPQLPESVEAVVTKLLAKNPAERFQTARELIDAITEIENPRSDELLPTVVAVAVPQMTVGAQTQNVWDGIDDSASVAVPLADSPATDVAPKRPIRGAERKTASKVPLFAVGAAVVLAVAAVAAVVMWPKKKPDATPPADTANGTGATPPPSGPYTPRPKDKDEPKAEGKVYDLPADLISPMTPVKPKEVFSLDYLDPANPKHLPPEEKFSWQPKELVAVLGSHRQRTPPETFHYLSLSPDGAVLLTGDCAIDTATRRTLDWPRLSVFSPSGKYAARGNKVWEIADLKKPSVEYPNAGSLILAFLTDDIVYASGGGNGPWVYKLGPQEPKALETFPNATAFAVSRDRRYFATVLKDRTCGIYHITANGLKEKFVIAVPEGNERAFRDGSVSCTFSDTGLFALAEINGLVRIWDIAAEKPKLLHVMDKQIDRGIHLTADGERLIAITAQALEVWSLKSNKPEKIVSSSALQSPMLQAPNDHFTLLTTTPDGQTILTGSAAGVVRFWGVEKGTVVERNPPRPQPVLTPTTTALSPDGRSALLFHENWQMHLWNLADLTSRLVAEAPPGWGPGCARFNALGTAAYVSMHQSGTRAVPTSAAGGAPVDFAPGFYPRCVSPDGKWLAAVSDKELAIWDVSVTPPKPQFARVPCPPLDSWHFTPDGRFLLAACLSGGDDAIRVWAMTDREPVLRQSGSRIKDHLIHCSMSPDGKAVVFCRELRLTEYSFKDGVLEFSRESGGADWTDFSADGQLLLVGTQTSVRVLDAASWKPLHEWPLRAHLHAGRFHPDGKHVLVTNSDGTTYVLRLPKEVRERAADLERWTAEWVLSVGGEVNVSGTPKTIVARDALPAEKFVLLTARLRNNPKWTDKDLTYFLGCDHLQTLDLRDSLVYDGGLANFRRAKTITTLLLDNTRVTDAGLEHFKDCKNLETLSLVGTQVRDAGLDYFKDCKKLASLSVRGTNVTPKAAAEFRKLYPKCYIDILDGVGPK